MLKSRSALGGWGGERGGGRGGGGKGGRADRKWVGEEGNEHKVFFWGEMECQRKNSAARTRECFGLICGIDKKVSFIQVLRLRSVYR